MSEWYRVLVPDAGIGDASANGLEARLYKEYRDAERPDGLDVYYCREEGSNYVFFFSKKAKAFADAANLLRGYVATECTELPNRSDLKKMFPPE